MVTLLSPRRPFAPLQEEAGAEEPAVEEEAMVVEETAVGEEPVVRLTSLLSTMQTGARVCVHTSLRSHCFMFVVVLVNRRKRR